ncbi:MAG TPA: aldo/keto reductase [Armatimonadota bacterium]|jgi:predicted aldo/keto reductase-like oxidoreductase
MLRRRLGRSEREVSVLGLGGHTYPVGDGGFRTPDERAELVARLVEGGVNYFDTTFFNEVELLADSFRRAGVGEGLHVSLQHVDGISDPRWRERLRGELESRLKVMGYSRAPLFIMGVGNGCPPQGEITAALEALHALKAEGLIEHIGLSCHELTRFTMVAQALRETRAADYLMLRYNPKFPQAAEELLGVAQDQDVGVVAMKVFCWDCGPDQWGRRISVFDPLVPEGRIPNPGTPTAAENSLRWVLRHPAVSAVVPAMNAMWEVEQNLLSISRLEETVDESLFAPYRDRLWEHESLRQLSHHAESACIRDRAAALLAGGQLPG